MSAARLAPKRNGKFYWDVVVFQVGDELFRVPKHPFMKSSIFRTTFSLPRPPGTEEGDTDNQPFKLEGINKREFEQFLQGLFPDPCVDPESLGIGVWVSILKLATMWEFHGLRTYAVDSMDRLRSSAAQKVWCGEQFKVSRWLKDGFEALIEDQATISDDDAEIIGWKTTARLLRIREKMANIHWPQSSSSLFPKERQQRHAMVTRFVEEEFRKELAECERAEGLIAGTPRPQLPVIFV